MMAMSLKDTDPRAARTVQEYRDAAGVDEGMNGLFHAFCLQGAVEHLQLRYARDLGPIPCISCTSSSSRSAASNSRKSRESGSWPLSQAELAPRYGAEFIGNEDPKSLS